MVAPTIDPMDALPLVFSDDGDMSGWNWLYFALWVLVDSLNMLMSVNICRSVFHRHRNAHARKQWQPSMKWDAVTVVVPCYLPNEKNIIFDTVDWICSHVDYAGILTLHVVYNTPRPMPHEEAKLQTLHDTWHGTRSRRVFVHKVEGSTSKAENLNHVIRDVLVGEVDRFVAIFDADHFPDPECLSTLMAFLVQHHVDCVQGSTYIRNRAWAAHAHRRGGLPAQLLGWLLANFIDAEFFITYFVWLPAIELIGKTGLFGGSVALWRYASLAGYSFSTQVQTEDIECSARAVLGRQKIKFCPEARSGELSPANLRAFWRQRQRWAIGWDQVSIRYMSAITKSGLSCREKAGLYYVFPGRWIACSVGLIAGIVHPVLAYVYQGQPWGRWLNGALVFGFFFYLISTAMTLSQMAYYRNWRSWPFIVLFYVAGPVYVLWQAVLVSQSLVRIVSGRDGGWAVTQRAVFAGGTGSPVGQAVHGATPSKPPSRGALSPPLPDDSAIAIALTRFCSPERMDSVSNDLDRLDFVEDGGGSDIHGPVEYVANYGSGADDSRNLSPSPAPGGGTPRAGSANGVRNGWGRVAGKASASTYTRML